MKKTFKLLSIFLVFSFLIFGVSDAFAGMVGDMFSEVSAADAGTKARLRPHLYMSSGYMSNQALDDKKTDSAWEARISPGIKAEIPWGRLYTEVDFTYSFSTSQSKKDDNNNSTYNLAVLSNYEISPATSIGVSNNLQLSEVPNESGRTYTTETARAQMSHRFSDVLRGDIYDQFQWYDDRATQTSAQLSNEYVDNAVGGKLMYKVSDILELGPSFSWNVRTFDVNTAKDYWQIKPALVALYDVGPRTRVRAHFGWTLRDFDEGDSENELNYGVGMSHNLSNRSVWNLDYSYSLQDTFDTRILERDGSTGATLDNLDRSFRVIKSHRLGTSVKYNLDEKNTVSAFVDFQMNDADGSDNTISTVDNDEKAMETGVKYVYRLSRTTSLDLSYTFGRKFSANDDVDTGSNHYTFHKANMGLNISF